MDYYIKDPLYVSVVNPFDKKNIRTYYFLGNIPNDILYSAQEGYFDETSKTMEWKQKDATILKNFYGINWKNKLTSEEPNEFRTGFNLFSNKHILGGNDFGDLDFFDNDIEIQPIVKKKELSFIDNNEIGGKIIYSNISVYAEDNLFDLRLKIQLITKIPIYRQFLFYHINGQGPYYTYQISINKIPFNIKWNDMISNNTLNIGGIGIDQYFEQNKNNIEFISYDLNLLLEDIRGHRINKVYIIDLYDILKDRNLQNILIDKYHFDLLYYGFIIKFWPQINASAFKTIISDSEKISSLYPKLWINQDILYNKQVNEQQIINKTYKYVEHVNYSMAITHSNIVVHSNMVKMNTIIRNIFDLLELDTNIYAMFINLKYGLRTYKYYVKKHASILNDYISIKNNKDTLSICIDKTKQIVLNISRHGSYEILSQWIEDDLISFENIIDKLSDIINPVIEKINKLGSFVFPMGGTLSKLTELNFTMLTLSIYYPFIFTLSEFNDLKNEFKKYEEVEIIKTHGIQISRTISFLFIKGIVDTNFVYDGYSWLYEDSNIIGRHIRIIHKTDRLQIELTNIKSIMEFNIIKRYIFTLINDFIKNNKLKQEKKIDDTKLKSIRKLHDLDPDLYNLQKYSSKAQAYSILCQSGRQPSIYNEDSIKLLSKDKQNKIVKYWNFTYNKPAYYLCNSEYPYINFITDKHPKGYCLPCCKKLKDTPGTKVAEINESCFKNKLFQTQDTDLSTYVLTYGKKILPGRLCNIPIDLINTIMEPDSMTYYIYGVKQFNNNNTNIGFINSIKVIFGQDCIKELANLVKNMEQYYTLGNGKASIYKSSNDLYVNILDNFVHYSNDLITNIDMDMWHHILTDLIRYKYGILVILIENKDNNIFLKTYEKNIIDFIDVCYIILDENGINPIIYMNQKDFVKDNKYISTFKSNKIKHLFYDFDTFIMDLKFIQNFVKNKKLEVKKLYINIKNMCYAIDISINDKEIYIPVIESNIPYNNKIPVSYNLKSEITATKSEILDIINEINKFRTDSIKITNSIKYNGKLIGMLSNDMLCYYHKVDSSDISVGNIIEFQYDPRDIDLCILNRNEDNNLSNNALIKRYLSNLYKLFFSEFTTILQKNKNKKVRNKLIELINKTNYTDSRSIQDLLDELTNLLNKYQNDLTTIYNFIEFAYFNSIDIQHLSKFIDATIFEFDFELLEELRQIEDRNVLINRLHNILDPVIVLDELKNIPQNYNIYTSCAHNNDQFFCKNNKLVIPINKINDLFEVLANDILNKSKTYLFMLNTSGIFDISEFIHRPYEFIEIFDVKELI